MNIDEIKEIIAILENTGITEFEWEESGVKVRIKKGKEEWAFSTGTHESHIVRPSAEELNPAQEGFRQEEPKRSPQQKVIKAPIVGTFYRAPSPDSEPYVEVGSVVKKGQIVCVIEAMKLMNEIESDVDGKIVEILGENAHPVEYGGPLFSVEPV
jgi:acetyl-CoA carboxylase biotin carboxyl carrier protein